MDSSPVSRLIEPSRSISRTALEYGAAVALCLLLTVLIVHQKFAAPYEFQGDSAMFYQSVESITARGLPFTNIGETSIWLHDYHVYRLTAAQLAKDPLLPSPVSEVNLLRWHSYFILYPIALLTLILPVPGVLVGIYVLSFTGALLFAYILLRTRGVPLLPALLYCVLLVTYPGWSQGLAGQFYPDRIFVLAGLAFMYAVSTRRSPAWLQIVLALVCASVTERGALIAGIATLAYLALSWRTSEQRYLRLGLGLALLAISGAEFHSLINTENGHYLAKSLPELVRWFSQPAYVHETLLFFLVNLPLLILALFDWRGAAVAFVLMLPNVIGTIDGQEKIGWTTSYHSYYMPALILASCRGLAAAYATPLTARARAAVLPAIAAAALFLAMLNPYSFRRFDVRPANAVASFIPQIAAFAIRGFGTPDSSSAVDDAIRKAVPEGSLVTAVEPAMPILYRHRNIQFYPLGIDQADYAVLSPMPRLNGKTYLFGGFETYRGPGEQAKIDAVLLARLRKDGYDVAHPLVFQPPGLVVLKHSKTMLRDL